MYDFWDYFYGWIVALAFLIPFAGAILIQVSVFVVAMFGSVLGVGSNKERGRTLTIRTNEYDYDEDR